MIPNITNRHSALFWPMLLLALSLAARPILAHGIGTPQRLNVPSGPYLLSVWTDPDPLRADESHVVVAVSDPATQEPIVTGVAVTVRLQSLADPAVELIETAATDSTNRLLYAAEFNGRVTPGRWLVAVSARPSPAPAAATAAEEVTFEVEIAPARGFNWLWVGGGGLAVLVVGWLLLSMRRAPAARQP